MIVGYMNFKNKYIRENSIRVEVPSQNSDEFPSALYRISDVAEAYQRQPLNDACQKALGISPYLIAISR
jgi:hypothetical protein